MSIEPIRLPPVDRAPLPGDAALAAALLRVVMGSWFIAHVGLRLTVIGWPAADRFFRSLGLPHFAGIAITATEALVGVALLIGWHVRAASLAGAAILLGATVLVHSPNGFLFTNANGGWEYPALWFVALVCQSLLGAGRWAIRVDRS